MISTNQFKNGNHIDVDGTIFKIVEFQHVKPGKGGELQLTDAVELLIQEGHPVHVVVHRGKRHDLGNPAGYIPANVDFGLRHEKYGPALYKAIKRIMADFEEEFHPSDD